MSNLPFGRLFWRSIWKFVTSGRLSVISCQLSVVSVSSRARTDAFDPDSYRGQPPMLVISAQNKNCVKNVSAKKQLFSD